MHTPGPWTTEPRGLRGAWVKGVTEEWTAIVCGDTDDRLNANARLIAAAPDLLAALKAIADGAGYYGAQAYEYKQIARAAISKVEGQP